MSENYLCFLHSGDTLHVFDRLFNIVPHHLKEERHCLFVFNYSQLRLFKLKQLTTSLFSMLVQSIISASI